MKNRCTFVTRAEDAPANRPAAECRSVRCRRPSGQVFWAALLASCVMLVPSRAIRAAEPLPATAESQGGTTAQTPSTGEAATHCLRLNFRGEPLEKVMNYLSEAAGFIIVLEANPKGTIDARSERALSRDEAVDLLNSSLLKSGCAALLKGRTLTIVNRDDTRTRSFAVRLGSNPESIPDTDQVVTQVIPVRFSEVSLVLKDLQPLVSSHAVMTANASANTIVITDTQASIHRVARLIEALDARAADVTVVKVFHLQNADPTEMAELFSELFPDQAQSENNRSLLELESGSPGAADGPPDGGGLTGANSENAGQSNQRTKKQAHVIAVADARTASLVVSASHEAMPQIEQLVAQLDANPARKEKLAMIHLKHASPQAVLKVMQDLFQKNDTSNTRSTSAETDVLESRSTTQTENQQSSATSGTSLGGNAGGAGGPGEGGGS